MVFEPLYAPITTLALYTPCPSTPEKPALCCLLQRWKLRPDHLDEFVDLWAEYDDGTGTIDPKDLEAMLLR